MLHSISYGLLVIANDFQSVLIIYFIEGIANSQESGALNAWFENSYKKEVGAIDTDRKLFKFYMGKNSYYVQLVSALAFVFGGLLATITFRNYVFFIQSIGMFFIAIFIFLFLYSPKKADTNNQKEENYFQLFVNGITFTVKNKKIFYYVLGQVLIFSTYTIWNSIILFPLYFSYTGSDLLASILRFSIWFTSSLFFIRIGSLAKRLESSTWIPRLFLAVSICLFGFFSVLVFFYPGSNTFNLLGIILVFIMLLIYSFIQGLNSILIDSLNLDLIPDTNRNSYYSLLPTLILFISTPLIIIAGQTIELFGLSFFAILLCILVIIGSLFISHGLKKDQSYTKDPVLTTFTTITQQVD